VQVKYVNNKEAVQKITVRLTKRDLVKLFVTVLAAEMVAHMPVARKHINVIDQKIARSRETIYDDEA